MPEGDRTDCIMMAMATTKLSTRQLAGTPYWYEDISYWMPDAAPNRNGYPSSQPPI